MATKWHHDRIFTGELFDADVETTMNGHWRVTLTNIENGQKTVTKYRGEGARERAMTTGRSVMCAVKGAGELL